MMTKFSSGALLLEAVFGNLCLDMLLQHICVMDLCLHLCVHCHSLPLSMCESCYLPNWDGHLPYMSMLW